MIEGSDRISSDFYPKFLDNGANPAVVIEETIDRRREDEKQNKKILQHYLSKSEASLPPVIIYK
jgi:hypothetical protein